MSSEPEQLPEAWDASEESPLAHQEQNDLPVIEQELLFSGVFAEPPRPPVRIPNMADVGLAAVLLIFGWVGAAAVTEIALHFHLFGVATETQAMNDIHYTLGAQTFWYLFSFLGCVLLFPQLWRKNFFTGIEWGAGAAFNARLKLGGAIVFCFVLAMVDSIALPGPTDAPIDEVFRLPGAAWMMFAFGITLAPFFEELAFRGFLLPALCTAYDWSRERIAHTAPPWPDAEDRPQWSLPAMAVGSVLTSIPFALIHGAQTGYSLGPFLLLVGVSLSLCWVRLSTRSLAASTVVHAAYNFLLFSLMFFGTGGFKNLDKM